MTSGSSQGLFVIVAVVIFGIFVVISYLLFRDKLQTGLASIFNDSIETTKGQLTPNPNILIYKDFYSKKGWTSNEVSSLTILGNGEALIEKNDFSDIRGGLFFSLDNYQDVDLKGVYSASIEIYIEDYQIKEGSKGDQTTFYLRTVLETGNANDFGKVYLSKLEKGKWIRLEINGVTPNANSKPSQTLQYSVSIDADVKAKIRVRNPKIELGKNSTAYTNY